MSDLAVVRHKIQEDITQTKVEIVKASTVDRTQYTQIGVSPSGFPEYCHNDDVARYMK